MKNITASSLIRSVRIIVLAAIFAQTNFGVDFHYYFKNNSSSIIYWQFWYWYNNAWTPFISGGYATLAANTTTGLTTVTMADGTPIKLTWGWGTGTYTDILARETTTGDTSWAIAASTVTFDAVVVKVDTYYSNNSATEDPVHPSDPSDKGAVRVDRYGSTAYDLTVPFHMTGDATFSPSQDYSIKDGTYSPYPWVTSSTTLHTSYSYVDLIFYAWYDGVSPEGTPPTYLPEQAVFNIDNDSPKTFGIEGTGTYTVLIHDTP